MSAFVAITLTLVTLAAADPLYPVIPLAKLGAQRPLAQRQAGKVGIDGSRRHLEGADIADVRRPGVMPRWSTIVSSWS